MRAVVVGGLGFLGGATVRELLARGDDVVVLDRHATQSAADRVFGVRAVRAIQGDATDRSALTPAFKRADEVYNFSGRLGTSELEGDIQGAIDGNISSAVAVFESAMASGVGAVFYPSKPQAWLNTYSITKFAAEQFAELFAARGLRVHVLRYFNAYGPGQATAPVRKIIPSFAMEAQAGNPLTVFGDGTQTVDMIYSQDLGRITVDVMRSARTHQPVDCGRGVALPVNEVAAAVNRHFGNGAGVRHVPMREGEQPGTRLVADTKPLQRLLTSVSFADWPSSLALTLDSYAGVPA